MNATSSSSSKPPELVDLWMILGTGLLSLIGLLGNLMIVIATIFSKNLHSRCQRLIGLLVAADVVVSVYLIQLRILMYYSWYFVTTMDCYFYSIHGLFALNVQAALGLVLGFDRLMAVLSPLGYNQVPLSFYILMLMLTFVYATLITFLGYLSISPSEIVPVCLPPTAYSGYSRIVWVFCSVFIAAIVVIVYIIANVKCRILNSRNTVEHSIRRVKRLLTSLNIVVGVYACSWFITVIGLAITQTVSMSPVAVQIINQQLAWLVIINASSNFFIYLFRSPEYKKSFFYIFKCGRSELPTNTTSGNPQPSFMPQTNDPRRFSHTRHS